MAGEPSSFRKLVSVFHSAREYLSPLATESKFQETGCITVQEFILAGDYLTSKFPTWQWKGGVESKRKDYLPYDKQYLQTIKVPCLKRVKQVEYVDQDAEAVDEAGWVTTHVGHLGRTQVEDLEEQNQDMDMPDLDDIPDMEEDLDSVHDPALLLQTQDNILRTRTYDLSITYDKYYQTPRYSLLVKIEFSCLGMMKMGIRYQLCKYLKMFHKIMQRKQSRLKFIRMKNLHLPLYVITEF
jgi:ubiquitin-like-conjugating enzyme ATG3